MVSGPGWMIWDLEAAGLLGFHGYSDDLICILRRGFAVLVGGGMGKV